nr:microtubule-associated protein tau-like [Rhipicephalus microplus]
MDKASATEVYQPSAAQTAARSDDTAPAAASAKPPTTAADQAQGHHDVLQKTADVATAQDATRGATQEPAKPSSPQEVVGDSARTAPEPSVIAAGGGEKPVSPAKSPSSDEKKSSGDVPSTYLERKRVSTEVPVKTPVMEDKAERVGPEMESHEVSQLAPVADRDGAVPSQEKQQKQPQSDSSVSKEPDKDVEAVKDSDAKDKAAEAVQKYHETLEEKTGAKSADVTVAAGAAHEETPTAQASSAAPDAAPSEQAKATLSAAEVAEGKTEYAKPFLTAAGLSPETCKSVADAGTKPPQEHVSPSGDGESLRPAEDAKQLVPDDTRPKSSIPPPPVYEAPPRTSSGKDNAKERQETEEVERQKAQTPESPVDRLKENSPLVATGLQEVDESIMPMTACHTGMMEMTYPDAIRKESAPREAYSSGASALNDLLDEEAIRAQLYPSDLNETKAEEASKPHSAANKAEKSLGDSHLKSTVSGAEPDAKTDANPKKEHDESRVAGGADEKVGEQRKSSVVEASQEETVIASKEVTKEEKPEKNETEVFPSPATTQQTEAPQKEEKAAGKVENVDDTTSGKKPEAAIQESKVTETAPPKDSVERKEEKAIDADIEEEQKEKNAEKVENVAMDDDSKEVGASDAAEKSSEPGSAKEETTQVHDVAAESDKPLKEAERANEDDAEKDTYKPADSLEPGVSGQLQAQETGDTLSKEKVVTENVPKEVAREPDELEVRELPPEEIEKKDEGTAKEQAAEPKVAEAVSKPEDKGKETKLVEETVEGQVEKAVSDAPEDATPEEAPVTAQSKEGVPEVTKDKAEVSEEAVVKTDNVSYTTAVKEEAAQPESTDESEKEKTEKEAPESGDKEAKEATTKSEVDEKEGEEPSSVMPEDIEEVTEQQPKSEGGEEAVPATEAAPEATNEEKKDSEPAEESEKPAVEAASEAKSEETNDGAAPSELESAPPAEAVKKKTGLPKSPSKRATGKGPPKTLDKKETSAAADAKAKTPSSPKKPSSIQEKGGPSPKKAAPTKNGVTSPSKTARTPGSEQKKLPPIKAPVGQAPKPDLKNVRSKIGSLENIKHKPKGGEVRVTTQKLEWRAASKVGSLDNAAHKPGGGDKKILSQKLEFKAQSKVGSLDNVDHKPAGGQVKVETQKLDFKDKASSKVGSLDNVKHKAGGGNVKILSEKLEFKERAASKIGSLPASDAGSTRGSESLSPTNLTSPHPAQSQQSQEDDVAANGHESDISPTKEEVAAPSSGVPASAPPPEVAQC